MSGGGRDLMGPLRTATEAESDQRRLCAGKGIEGDEAGALAALRAAGRQRDERAQP